MIIIQPVLIRWMCVHVLFNTLQFFSPKKVTLAELKEMARNKYQHNLIRTGATNNPQRRIGQYARKKGYTGTIYWAKSADMRKDEDYLLQFDFRDNKHKKSNMQNENGYVYVIDE